jgi:hypothetical protein
MSPVRKLVDDLIEKRLWPVALALVIALIAIPVLIGGSSAGTGATDVAAAPVAAPAAKATPAVELIGPPAVRTRPGKVRDPFRRKAKAPDAGSVAKPAATSSPAPSGSSGSAAKSGSSSSSTSTASAPKTAAKPKATTPASRVDPAVVLAARSVYETVAHVTGVGANYEHPLDRLAVIGDPANPALQFAGVSAGGEYAIFLLGPAATPSGADGACVVADPCRAIGLRKGDKLTVSVARPNAAPRHYVVEVTSLRRVARSSVASAQRERGHVAHRGPAVLRALSQDPATAAALTELSYSRVNGIVVLTAGR